MATKTPTAKQRKKLAEFAAGQPVDRLAADRYRRQLPDVAEVLRLAAADDLRLSKTGRLRCAALVAVLEDDK